MRLGLLLLAILAALSVLFLLQSPDSEDPAAVPLARPSPSSGTGVRAGLPPAGDALPDGGATTDASEGESEGAARAALLMGRVLDEQGHPLADAAIRVERLPLRALRGAEGLPGRVLARASSAPDGTFAIPGLEAAWVRVTAEASGFATAGVWTVAPSPYIELTLPPAGTLSVRVEDADGRPAPGARVVVGARRAVHDLTCDDEGLAVFEALPPGAAHLVATASDATGRSSAVEALVIPGETKSVTLTVEALVRVGGRVIDATSELPVAGARVHVARPGHAEEASPTDSEGRFEAVAGATPGRRVHVAVQAPGYAPALEPVNLGGSTAVVEVEVRLHQAAPWRGRVVDASGKPVAAAQVAYTDDGIAGRDPAATRTDDEGRFELPPPPPPTPGRRVLLIAEARTRRAALALRPGQDAPADLTLVLERGRVVSARVVDSAGAPIAGVQVGLVPHWRGLKDRRRPGPSTSRLLAMTTTWQGALSTATDADGRARLDGVPDGSYRATLGHGRLQTERPDVVDVQGEGVDIGTLVLGEGAHILGRVLDERGEGLAGATVRLAPLDGRTRTRRTDAAADGSFRFEAVGSGHVRLTAHHPNHVEARADVEVADADLVQDLVLESGATLRIRLKRGDRPYSGTVTVERRPVERQGGAATKRTLRARSGMVTLWGVPDGHWRLALRTPEGAGGAPPGPLETRSGATYDVDVTLAASAGLTGRLVTADRAPVVGGLVMVQPEGQSRRLVVTTGIDGQFQLDALPPGGLRIEGEGPGGAPVYQGVVLAPGEKRSLDLVLERGGAVGVQVVDARGRGVAEARVVARRTGMAPSRHPGTRRTDTQGNATLEDLAAGQVDVSVVHADGRRGRTSVVVVPGETTQTRVEIRP